MNPARFSIRFPDGREFGPADMMLIARWAREGRVPVDGMLVDNESGSARPVMSEPALAHILQSLGISSMPASAPPTFITPVAIRQGDDTVATIIPYKNPHALIGYYTSIGALIPFIGLIAGPAAIVLGVKGLRELRKNPKLHGLAHAWVAIILGSIGTLISLGCSFGAIMAIIS